MGAQTRGDVLGAIEAHRSELRQLGIKRLGLFGSFARNEAREDSDVDILVEFEQGCKTFDNFMQAVFLLEQVLGRRVELITPESLSPYLRPHILKEVQYVALGD